MYYRKLLYLSIKTATKYKNLEAFGNHDLIGYKLFAKKFKVHGGDLPEIYKEKGSMLPEYAVVTCVSLGYYDNNNNFIHKTFTGFEKNIIKNVAKALNNFGSSSLNDVPKIICGFKPKSFDIPFLNKKISSYGYAMPIIIRTYKTKPWELLVEDLFEIWKGSSYNMASLMEMAYSFNIPLDKDEILPEIDDNQLYHDKNFDELTIRNERKLNLITTISEKLFKTITI